MFRNPLTDVIVVLVIVLLVMGPKKLPQLGRGLGQGMREFKDGITGDAKDDDAAEAPSLTQANAMPQTGTTDERPAQTAAAAPGRETGSEPRA